jgi:hypothetical protein
MTLGTVKNGTVLKKGGNISDCVFVFLDALPGDVWFVLLCCSEVLPVSVLGQALRFDSDEQLTAASPACARGSRSPRGSSSPYLVEELLLLLSLK